MQREGKRKERRKEEGRIIEASRSRMAEKERNRAGEASEKCARQ